MSTQQKGVMDILEYWPTFRFINIMLNYLSQNFESFLQL